MAEKLCTLRTQGGGGGAKYTETSLWTNPSPTSDFGPQAVTLSDTIDKYKYIKVIWKGSKTSTSDSEKGDTVIDVNTLKKQAAASYYTYQAISAVISSMNYSRAYGYASGTSIRFYNCVKTTNGAATNSYCIPLEILGLNELDHAKGFDETVLWTNSAPTSSFAAQTVTLSESMDNYDYLKINYRVSTSNATGCSEYVKVTDFLSGTSSTNRGVWQIEALSGQAYTVYRRTISPNSDRTLFSIQDGTLLNYGNNTMTTGQNGYTIPTSIVGCKFR